MSLKDLRNRIKTTKSTRRITSAMKMVSILPESTVMPAITRKNTRNST